MFKLVFVSIILLFTNVYTQLIIGNPCTIESSKSPGQCRLLTECQAIRDDVVFLHKLPQTCGFEGTQAIVCCPRFRRPGDISRKKCREYASYIEEKNECGHKIVKRIIGGEPTGRTEFPHMAMIGGQTNSENIKWWCGGSVISERYILTAAQCLFSQDYGESNRVLLGVANLNDTNHRQEIKIAKIIPHPDYKEYFSRYNDIGLLKLEKPIEISSYVRPACLYTKSQITATKAGAIGWGSTDNSGSKTDDLLKVTLAIVDYEFCNRSYGITRKLKNGIIDDMQVCTGDGISIKDTCQGDAGGPLQIRHDSDDAFCMYDIVGITSFGKGCGYVYAVSTRVSYYIKWIEDEVWPDSTE